MLTIINHSDVNTFTKAERICKQTVIDKLFGGGNHSMAAFPLRAVYMTVPEGDAPVSILVSVPKRKMHLAVDRNRMKRQVREAYRLHKSRICQFMTKSGQSLTIAFVCISDKPCSSAQVSRSVTKILQRVEEQLSR